MGVATLASTRTEGESVFKFSGYPIRLALTIGAASDTYTVPFGVREWACKPSAGLTGVDSQAVSFDSSTNTFTIESAGGSGSIWLYIWPSK